MSEEIKQSKLDSKLDDSKSRQTGRQTKKLKFTDYAIERFVGNFIYVDDEGNTKTRDRVTIKFDVQKNSVLKGLKLVQFNKTRKKYFFLRYWLNGKYLPLFVLLSSF